MTKNIKTKKILKQVQNDKNVETGRSMTEMLGVLAIIGVLSIGGIAGYRYAMDKHYANELLNEASKRATIVAMQITSGKSGTGLSIAEFTQPSGYLFGVDTSYVAGEKTFNLTLTKDPSGNIDEAICTQMKNATGNNGVMVVDPTCSKITVNADMSGDVSANMIPTQASCTAEDKKWCSGNNKCVTKGTSCCADVTLNTCLTGCDSSDGTLTYAREGMQCDLHGIKDGVCLSGVCSEIPSTCDANHLPGCTTSSSCENVDGRWCDDNVLTCGESGDCGRCMTYEDCVYYWCDGMGGTLLEDESFGDWYCCNDGYETVGGDWVVSQEAVCGCPSGTEQGEDLSQWDLEVCCQTDPSYKGFGGQVGDSDIEGWYPVACGCPSDAPDLVEYMGQYYCCDPETGAAYDYDGTYLDPAYGPYEPCVSN